jgi:hypothetical protein
VAVWIVAGVALVVALAAFAAVRRVLRKVDMLTQSYWELRYDYTRLRSQVSRLDPSQSEGPPTEPAPPASVSFVPLASMRKKDQ